MVSQDIQDNRERYMGIMHVHGTMAADAIIASVRETQAELIAIFESKLSAIGYGFLIPFFFVVSGVNFDVSALIDDPQRAVLVPIFFLLFLVVRGVPALLLYRNVLELRDRAALAFFSSTELPLVVAITTIAVAEGHMRATTSASSGDSAAARPRASCSSACTSSERSINVTFAPADASRKASRPRPAVASTIEGMRPRLIPAARTSGWPRSPPRRKR